MIFNLNLFYCDKDMVNLRFAFIWLIFQLHGSSNIQSSDYHIEAQMLSLA